MRLAARIAATLLSAFLGLALCLALVRVDEALHLLPRLPAPGGEDDFSVRAAAFFGLACPALAVLGGYLGWLAFRAPVQAARAWAGVALGSIASFLLAYAFPAGLLWLARTPLGGNGAFVVFLALWVVLATGLARAFARRRR